MDREEVTEWLTLAWIAVALIALPAQGSECVPPNVCVEVSSLAACCGSTGSDSGKCHLPDLVEATETDGGLHALVLERLAPRWPELMARYFGSPLRHYRPRAALALLEDNPDAAGSGAEWTAQVDLRVRADVEAALAEVRVARVQDGRGGSSLVVLPEGSDALVSVVLRELRASPGFSQEELAPFEATGLAPADDRAARWRLETLNRIAPYAGTDDWRTAVRGLEPEAARRGETAWLQEVVELLEAP